MPNWLFIAVSGIRHKVKMILSCGQSSLRPEEDEMCLEAGPGDTHL